MGNTRAERIEELMLDLVRIQSDTGTRKEIDVETGIVEWLGRCQYFKSHPDYFGRYYL